MVPSITRVDPVGCPGMARHTLSPAQQETYLSVKNKPCEQASTRLLCDSASHSVGALSPPPCPPLPGTAAPRLRPPLSATTRRRPQPRGAAAGGSPALGALARGERRQAPCPAVPHGPTPLTNSLCAPAAGASSGDQRSFPPAEAN